MELNHDDLAGFIEKYRNENVRAGALEITLDQALNAEEVFCPADKITRQDPAVRGRYLAGMLHRSGVLRPEDLHILEDS